MILCVDVSSNNGVIDWPTLAKYLLAQNPDAIVFPKANEYDWTSPTLHPQRMGAHAAGIRWVFPYDFARFDLASGRAEAERFMAALGADGGLLTNEAGALDLEYISKELATADLRAYVVDWFGAWHRATGLPLILYSSVEQLRAFHMYEDPTPLDDPNIYLWLAAPDATQPPTSPKGKVLFWQYDWHGQVPGITGDVDLSWYLGDIPTLRSLTWGNQPDPVAGKPATGTPDVDRGADTPTQIKAALAAVKRGDNSTAIADLSQVLTTFGLVGS